MRIIADAARCRLRETLRIGFAGDGQGEAKMRTVRWEVGSVGNFAAALVSGMGGKRTLERDAMICEQFLGTSRRRKKPQQ